MEKPVVHTAVGGAAEMIEPGRHGFLYPVGDTPALVGHLSVLADAKMRARMGRSAREKVEALFSERAMIDRYEKLLVELQAVRPSREPCAKPTAA
jgi:glycosyltransferase involved in cell wall biosynthesis